MSSVARSWWDAISADLRGARQPIRPDYAGGSTLNLMETLGRACGAGTGDYAPLRGLEAAALQAARNIVLIVVDGLGLRHLERQGRGSSLHRQLRASMTSVFPSTTASAITTIMTGLAPRRHALTGWHIYFEEIDRVLASLPLVARDGAALCQDVRELAHRLFEHRPIYAGLKRRAFVLSPAPIDESAFNRYHTTGAERCAYGGASDLFAGIAAIVREGAERKFIYAYYPELDSLAHAHGVRSGAVDACLHRFDDLFARFCDSIRDSDTVVLVTADHGFVDSPPGRVIELDDHPDLAAMLARPLCGERRVAYCYVKPERRADFERYVGDRLGQAATLHRSEDLARDGWFGPGESSPRLAGRIGDYAIVMKGRWTVKDWMPGEKRHDMIGVHGGLDPDEMLVPLIVVEA